MVHGGRGTWVHPSSDLNSTGNLHSLISFAVGPSPRVEGAETRPGLSRRQRILLQGPTKVLLE